MSSVAYRLRRFAYATDFKAFSKDDIARWQGKIDLMVASGIQFDSHPSHSSLTETIQLFEALGSLPPKMGHLSLLTDNTGSGLSKRLGSLSLRELRSQGFQPMAISSLLAKIGTSE